MTNDEALLALLNLLREGDYHFVTPTPATHARVIARPDRQAASNLTDVLGWSLPFQPGAIESDILDLLQTADVLKRCGDTWRCLIRVSNLRGDLYIHSAFPTDDENAVFFGPDSYRFAELIAAELGNCDLAAQHLIVDIGTGAGVGAVLAAKHCPEAAVMMTDINPQALRLARINARAAGIQAWPLRTAGLEGIDGFIDIVTANPPYLVDDRGRLYRHGGTMHGGQIAHDMTAMALPRLAARGRMILYTGSAILSGEDRLHKALQLLADINGCNLRYREIDPDVFGEELEYPAYADVDRIALVAAIFERRG